MKIFLNQHWYRILLYGAIFTIFFGVAANSHDPDFGWHLLVGKEIVTTQSIPGPEHTLYPILGAHWIDHEWLSNALLYLTYSSGSYGDVWLYLFFAICGTASLGLLEYITRKWFLEKNDRDSNSYIFFITLFHFVSLTLLLYFFGVRVQVLSWLFFLSLIFLFLSFLETRTKKILWFFPLIMLLWANIHGSFPLGLAFYFGFFLIFTLFLRSDLNEKTSLFFLGIIGTVITLITPYTIDLWRLIFIEYTQSTYYQDHISEWLPAYSYPPFDITLFIFLPLLFLTFFLFSKKISSLPFFKLYPSFVLPFFIGYALIAYLYIESRRHAPFFLFITVFLIAPLWIRNISLEQLSRPILLSLFSFFLIMNITLGASEIMKAPNDPFLSANSSKTPRQMVNFLQLHEEDLITKNTFNEYSWGGYLEWTLPGWRFFIDGRFPQMPLFQPATSYLEEYRLFFEDQDSLQNMLTKYDVGLVILKSQQERDWQKNEIPALWHYFHSEQKIMALNESNDWFYAYFNKNWDILYSDEISIVYKR
jgi:hypothetical protein